MTNSRIWLRSLMMMLGLLALVSACATAPSRSGAGSGGAGGSPHYKIGKPYQVKGRWYYPREDPNYAKTGTASWYGEQFHGRLTANGEIFDMNRLSAAHPTLPLPSMVEVSNLENGRTLVVRLNDRGPFVSDRIIDMSREAARQLGFERQGTARVRVRFVAPAPLTAEAPSATGRDRVARAAPAVMPTAPAAAPISGPNAGGQADADARNGDQISQLLTSMESAPAMTLGAEEFAIAESAQGAPGEAEIAAADLSTADPDDARFVRPGVSADGAAEAIYVVRVAALKSLDNIESLRARLGDIGTLRLSRVETEGGAVFYRVNLGPFASIETAAEKLAMVRAAGYNDASLVTLTP